MVKIAPGENLDVIAGKAQLHVMAGNFGLMNLARAARHLLNGGRQRPDEAGKGASTPIAAGLDAETPLPTLLELKRIQCQRANGFQPVEQSARRLPSFSDTKVAWQK